MEPHPDVTLLRRYASTRDAEAFADIVRRYQGLVFGTCLRILGNRARAEDATQECFLALAVKADAVRDSLAGWLHRCATGISINARKKGVATIRQERAYAENKNRDEADREMTWEQAAPHVDAALEQLPQDERYLLVEHFLRQRPLRDLAVELNLSAPTLSRRTHAALERLRKHLKKAGILLSTLLVLERMGEAAAGPIPATLAAALGKMAMVAPGPGMGITVAAGAGATIGGAGLWGSVAFKVAAAAFLAASVGLVGLEASRRFSARGRPSERATAKAPAPPASPTPPRPAEQEDAGELRFPLQEVSILSMSARDSALAATLQAGQWSACRRQRDAAARAYPPLESARPLFGAAALEAQPAGPEAPKSFRWAIDESRGTGTGYDRLYFDANGDLDLTNDPPVEPMKVQPVWARSVSGPGRRDVTFDGLDVALDRGSEAGAPPLRLVPRLVVERSGSAALGLIPATARQGQVRIGEASYEAVLGHTHGLSARFDRPTTGLYLISLVPGAEPGHWPGGDELRTMHHVGEALCRFAATPAGDQLIARPCRGETGLFEVGPGGRDVAETLACGYLRSEDAVVPVGRPQEGLPELRMARQARVPVGDYAAGFIDVVLGSLSISVSDRGYSTVDTGEPQGESAAPAIRIRREKPFVLDFSIKPTLVFIKPAEGARFRPGQPIEVNAALLDPVLNLLIRRIADRTRKVERRVALPDGTLSARMEYADVNATVTLSDSAGSPVATTVMPFWPCGTCGSSVRVPRGATLASREEEFTLTVTYDTLELYGKLSASRKILIAAE